MRKFFAMVLNSVVEIRFHIFRSSLSLIGIVLGVMNLTAMFSIIEGAKAANESIMNSLGSPDIISVSLDYHKFTSAADRQNFALSWSDYVDIRKNAVTVKNVSVEMSTRDFASYKNISKNYQIIGVLPFTFPMNKYVIESGRQITEFDNENGERICVIGSDVVKNFFKGEDPIGKRIKLKDVYFRVVGVIEAFGKDFEEKGANNPLSWKNERILIPANTMITRFAGRNNFRWFNLYIQSESVDMVTKTISEIRSILMRSHNNRDVFNIQSVLEWQNESEKFTMIWQIVLGVVSGISLLVGGVGIMNVMLASFTERMKEIGIRKAIGATNLDIFILFLVETIVICFIGGLIGLLFGYIVSVTALSSMLTETMNTTPEFSLDFGWVAILFSMGTGLIAGLYPAFKASQLEPVEALRYE